ncbi:MAG: sulfotransferase [Arenibacterium sp.]
MIETVDKNALRVINLGLPKSGTTTLGVALRHAGLRVADWRIRQGQTQRRKLLRAFVGDLLYRGYYETGDPLALLDEFDAVTEMSVASNGFSLWPQMDWALLAAIRAHYPNTKFILSHRDAKSLVKSMMGWSNLGRSRLPKQNVPGLPTGFGTSPEALERWVEGHYAFCRHAFRDDPDFLEYDLGDADAAEKIGAFLGIDLPWWGRANAKSEPTEPVQASAPFIAQTQAAPAIGGKTAATRQVFMHGGAHRTGSSSFQLCLAHNAKRLEAAGYSLAFPARDGVESGTLALRLPGPRHDHASCVTMVKGGQQKFNAQFGTNDKLIMSEENLPGRMVHFYSGQFFPAAEKRADVLLAAMQANVAHLLYVVRDYAEFFVSAHRQRAAYHRVHPFSKLREAVVDMSDGWPDLIELFQRHLQPKEITVVEYRQRGESRSLLARMLPDIAVEELEEPAKQLNRSATDAGLLAIQAQFAAKNKMTDAERNALADAHRNDTSDKGFARFSQEDRELLNDRYERDLERIENMPNVTFVRG